MAVIQTVSKLTDTHVLPCRESLWSHVGLTAVSQVYFRGRGFVEAFPASSHDRFLSSLFSFSFCWITVRHSGSDSDQSAGEKPS